MNLPTSCSTVYAPAKVAAKLAKKQATEKGIPADDIGIFFISPCPAKVYSLHKEEVSNEKYISGVLSQSDVYFRLVEKMNKVRSPRKLSKCGYSGIGWGSSGGESNSLGLGNYIHCSGVRNVLGLLREMSDGKLDGADFVELNMCPGGCVGGVLNVENPFIARNRMRQLADRMKIPPRRWSNTDWTRASSSGIKLPRRPPPSSWTPTALRRCRS